MSNQRRKIDTPLASREVAPICALHAHLCRVIDEVIVAQTLLDLKAGKYEKQTPLPRPVSSGSESLRNTETGPQIPAALDPYYRIADPSDEGVWMWGDIGCSNPLRRNAYVKTSSSDDRKAEVKQNWVIRKRKSPPHSPTPPRAVKKRRLEARLDP